jgi:gamma-glutamyltranspeptidase/glutathione hydrolase
MLDRGNAVDAVVAGVLVAAAETPTVFLGPLQLIAGGGGAGLLAFDGRILQPGKAAPRPRGFLPDETIPEAARVATPMLPATIAAVVAALGSSSMSRLCAPAIAWAQTRSFERAALLEAFSERGVPTLSDDAVSTELLATAGRAARGILTRDDLTTAVPRVVRLDPRTLPPSGLVLAPWATERGIDASLTQVIAAVDARGVVAIACYEAPVAGVAIQALGVVAPYGAAPVLRGKPRVAPGEPRPAAAPIALRHRPDGVDLALGVAAHADAELSLQAIAATLDDVPTVAGVFALMQGGRSVAIFRTRDAIRVLGSS